MNGPQRFFPVVLAALLILQGCGRSDESGARSAPSGGGERASSGWTSLGNRSEPSSPSLPPAQPAAGAWSDYDPPALYPGSVAEENIPLTMDDGVVISLDVVRPALPTGEAVSQALPTIVTFTPYNKNFGDTVPLGGATNTSYCAATTTC